MSITIDHKVKYPFSCELPVVPMSALPNNLEIVVDNLLVLMQSFAYFITVCKYLNKLGSFVE